VRKGLVAALAVVLVAGAAVAAVPLVERHAAAAIKADLERDPALTVGSVEVGLLDRKVVLKALRFRRAGELTVGRVEASGLAWPLAELVEGRTPFAGLDLGDPMQARHLALRDLGLSDENGRWTVGSVAIDDFHLERYEPLRAPDQLTHLLARVAAALSIGRLEQKDTAFAQLSTGDRVTVASLVIERFVRGEVGAMAMTGLAFTPKPPRDPVFGLADFRLTDLDLRRVAKAIGSAGWRPGLPVGRIDLGSASLSGFSGEAFTRYGISLGSITQQSQPDGKDVRHARLQVEGFVLDPPSSNREGLQIRIVLQAMGLKQLKLASDCAGTEDRAKGEVSIDRCAVGGPDLGEVSLSLKIVQADAPFWRAIDEGNTFALLGSKAGVGGAKLVVADRGLVERAVKAIAATSGRSAAEVRAAFAQEVRRFQPPGILITEELGKLLDTVARFIERGGNLAVEVRPESPIGLDKAPYFARPGPDLVNLLGLSATLSR